MHHADLVVCLGLMYCRSIFVGAAARETLLGLKKDGSVASVFLCNKMDFPIHLTVDQTGALETSHLH